MCDVKNEEKILTLGVQRLNLAALFPQRHSRTPAHGNEAHLSTEQSAACAHSRVSCSHGHQEWTCRAGPSSRQRPQEAHSVVASGRAWRTLPLRATPYVCAESLRVPGTKGRGYAQRVHHGRGSIEDSLLDLRGSLEADSPTAPPPAPQV